MEAQPRIKFSGRRVVEMLLIFFVFCILISILFPTGSRSRENARRSSCQSNLKQIMLSVMQYAADYDAKYPPVALAQETSLVNGNGSAAFGWADALEPYHLSARIFQCPSEKITPARTEQPQTEQPWTPRLKNRETDVSSSKDKTRFEPQYTDYWLNARVAGKNASELEDSKRTITLGDGSDGTEVTNARYHLMSIPHGWLQDEKSPLFRHLGGANFAFADGHVKWRNSSSWKNELDMQNGPTLRLQPTN